MRWFEGSIPAAIQTSKAKKSVFIVFITGEDAKTQEMEACLHNDEVTQLCEEGNCVAVKLDGSSNDCKFFSQIYPVVVIPSTYFIGDNGKPLEVIGEVKSQQDFTEKVKKALELQRSNSSGSSDVGATAGAASSTTELAKTTPSDDKCSDSASASTSKPAAAPEAGSGDESLANQESGASAEDLAQRVERAKELVEMKRQDKARKEAEDERRREIERRNIGQGVQKLREQQKEQELREARKEWKKDKEEDRLARQRVKEEIERDRAEKAMRFNKEKEERAKAADEARKQKLVEQQAAMAAEQAQRSDIARIQFRMADGSSVTQQFPATDTFDTVQQFITQHVGSTVNLSMSFPRRRFTDEDSSKTLQELQLAPSAAILVLPSGRSDSRVTSSNDSVSLSSLTNLVLSPFFFIWNLLASLLGLSGSSGQGGGSASSPRSESATGGDRDRSGVRKRPAPASSRQEGAVRRFRNAQDDEDDEDRNTWNGNSTQQM